MKRNCCSAHCFCICWPRDNRPGSAQAQAKFTFKGQSSHPASSNFHLIFKLYAEQMEKMSGGRIKIDTQPGGAIVPPFEVFDAVSKGILDVGMITFGYIQGRNTATIPMSHGPLYGMDGEDYWGWYLQGGGTQTASGILR